MLRNYRGRLLVVAAAAPVLLVIGQVITGIGTLVGIFSSLSTALMVLNPIVLVVVAVISANINIGRVVFLQAGTVLTPQLKKSSASGAASTTGSSYMEVVHIY